MTANFDRIVQQEARQLPGVDLPFFLQKIHHHQQLIYAAETAHSLCKFHPDYDKLAGRLFIHDLYARTESGFYDTVQRSKHELSPSYLEDVDYFITNAEPVLHHENDRLFTYAALKTLAQMYLMDGERPQAMFLRVSLQIHGKDIERVQQTYRLLSTHKIIHATPTLINSGRKNPQLSSCFLMSSPNMDTFWDCMKKCHTILAHYGGLGCYFHRIPARYFVSCAKILNEIVKLSSNKRRSACCVYIEPWHASVFDFLALKTTGGGTDKARHLFLALWVNDLFMERVYADGTWSLLCPEKCPGLETVWGAEFCKLYENYEQKGLYEKQVAARSLFKVIVNTQIETGGPFMLYKDTCNRTSTYPGTIQGSNLCTEIIEFTSPAETAVCNLASIALPQCVNGSTFDFEQLKLATAVLVRNLDRTIDVTAYPTECSRTSNLLYRPIGIGVQGLGDVFQMLGYEFDSERARCLNRDIFKIMHETAVATSKDLAAAAGTHNEPIKQKNMCLIAVMPTATTSIVLGNSESVEAITSNAYVRRTNAGDFIFFNRHLMKELIASSLFTSDIINQIIRDRGSVKNIRGLSESKKRLYRTVWEIPQKSILEMSADRLPYVDQSQSISIFLSQPSMAQVCSMHFRGWKLRLKTGMYYLRSQPAVNAIQFTLPALLDDETKENDESCSACTA